MKFSLLSLAVFASAVAAQTTAAADSSSDCAADYIVSRCLETENDKLDACVTGDWNCMCSQWQNIVTCYNNCPNDQRVSTAKGQEQIFCGYASQFPSATPTKAAAAKTTVPTPAATTSGAAAQSQAEDAAATATTTGTNTATSTGTAASTTKSSSAGDLVLNTGSILAAVAGVVAAVL
ncbi:hypothetical protein B0T26DRAFT_745360 [Lasiosphaeria miniovina]|uniref:GPI anchored serine-threonine rich protein n=1 Tax=Lasiosphaeria miniovina TaxID=1954250 RepID=A0AA40BFJ5_9PEZI|nr:uncharacterized protein B0T26DRAFT_745360 [Lasiosphaeria miniovina]KAK0733300.1 hypothetical protein B0T26DRAFT_745360 [Lasiosphaeria miniovina]